MARVNTGGVGSPTPSGSAPTYPWEQQINDDLRRRRAELAQIERDRVAAERAHRNREETARLVSRYGQRPTPIRGMQATSVIYDEAAAFAKTGQLDAPVAWHATTATSSTNFAAWAKANPAITPTIKEPSAMNLTTKTAVVLGGTVGQVVNGRTNAVIWQSEPFTDTVDGDGDISTFATDLARKATDAQVDKVLAALFTSV